MILDPTVNMAVPRDELLPPAYSPGEPADGHIKHAEPSPPPLKTFHTSSMQSSPHMPPTMGYCESRAAHISLPVEAYCLQHGGHVEQTRFGFLGILAAVFWFPLGIVLCFMDRRVVCQRCGMLIRDGPCG